MKKLLVFILLFSNFALAMEAPPSRKRGGQEPEEQGPAKVAFVEPTVQERSAFEALPNEIKKQILEYLVTATGGTADIRLAKAADDIRNFMALGLKNTTFRPFLEDENLHGYLITQLADRYAGGNRAKAAFYLRTDAGGRWLAQQEPKEKIFRELAPFFLDAVRNNAINSVSYLLRYLGVDLLLNTRIDDTTPLMLAAAGGFATLVEKLLESLAYIEPQAFADYVNTRKNDGMAALAFAADGGHASLVEKLLAVPGIKINEQDEDLITPLMHASKMGRTEVVQKLLAAPGIMVNIKNINGNTALMFASEAGHTPVVEELLASPGIDENKRDYKGNTALMKAAQNGHNAIVEKLLAVPTIDINRTNDRGLTALMYASERGNTLIVKKLLEMPGIAINARASDGKTALSFAQVSKSPNKDAIIKLLKEYGAAE